MDSKTTNVKYTKRELNILLKMRRKPRTRAYLQKACKIDSDDAMNLILSELSPLFYVVEDDREIWTGTLALNYMGETVAQAEYDRRFDMYYTRALSFLSLVTAIAALVISSL